MRSLQRILLERKTRRFVDEMIHKYADIRLCLAMREMSRKRPRSEVHKSNSNQDEEHGEKAERSTSSGCRTESERSSTMVDSEHSQTGKGPERRQQDETHIDRWRMSDTRTVSEYGSAFSSTRLTRLLEEEDDGDDGGQRSREDTYVSRRESDLISEASGVEDNQGHCSSFSECDTSSACFESAPTSTQASEGNQTECRSEVSASPTETESPPTSRTTTTENRLPRLRPAPTVNGVIPNCCDFFTSPHPHYSKEVIGKGDEGSSHSVSSKTNSTDSDSNSEAADNERGDSSDTSTVNNQDGDDFEMWDYVCPQFARHVYRNEWV